MKVFCIGFNKTGTTSLKKLFENNNFKIGNQYEYESMINYVVEDNTKVIIDKIKKESGDIFYQDIPFSLPNFYIELYKNFPNSVFLLSVRDNEKLWYESLCRFHKIFFGSLNLQEIKSKNEEINRVEEIRKKYLLDIMKCDETNPYDEDMLKNRYLTHIDDCERFFRDKKNIFGKINIKNEKNTIEVLEKLLNKPILNKKIPHLNKSKY